jgi:hypothetical protein
MGLRARVILFVVYQIHKTTCQQYFEDISVETA